MFSRIFTSLLLNDWAIYLFSLYFLIWAVSVLRTLQHHQSVKELNTFLSICYFLRLNLTSQTQSGCKQHTNQGQKRSSVIYFSFGCRITSRSFRRRGRRCGGESGFRTARCRLAACGGGNRMSIIITVVILTTIIIIIIIIANQKAEERRAHGLVSEACTADYRPNFARLPATNGLHYPKCVSEWRSIHF